MITDGRWEVLNRLQSICEGNVNESSSPQRSGVKGAGGIEDAEDLIADLSQALDAI